MRMSIYMLLFLLHPWYVLACVDTEGAQEEADQPIGIDFGGTYSCSPHPQSWWQFPAQKHSGVQGRLTLQHLHKPLHTFLRTQRISSRHTLDASGSVAVVKDGKLEVITDGEGNRTIPSFVAFTPDGQTLIGQSAKDQLITDPQNTIFDFKRMIGRSWSELTTEVDLKGFPFNVVNKDNKPYIEVTAVGADRKLLYTPEELTTMVFTKLKEMSEKYLGGPVRRAVLTVPTYFNDHQRLAIKEAANRAGLEVLRLVNEPSAATITYGLEKEMGDERNVMVFHLGGGTSDVTLLTIDNGVHEVLSTGGSKYLGGDDFDMRIVDNLIRVYKKKTGLDIRASNKAVQRLREQVEKAKKLLSDQDQVQIDMEFFHQGEPFSEILTRATFETLNKDLFQDTLRPIAEVLEEGEVNKSDVHTVILTGGSYHIPKLKAMVTELFGDQVPILIQSPDEVVATGAAIQADLLVSVDEDVYYLCATPAVAIGIQTAEGHMREMIPRNTPISTQEIKKSLIFSTAVDNQSCVTIRVLEGVRPLAEHNHLLGIFNLHNIPNAPWGLPKIEVTFNLNVNGFLGVTAEDLGTGNKQKLLIHPDVNALYMEEIEQMIKDGEMFEEEDNKIREQTEHRLQLESALDCQEELDLVDRGDDAAEEEDLRAEELDPFDTEDDDGIEGDLSVEELGPVDTENDEGIEGDLTEAELGPVDDIEDDEGYEEDLREVELDQVDIGDYEGEDVDLSAEDLFWQQSYERVAAQQAVDARYRREQFEQAGEEEEEEWECTEL